MSTKSTLKEDNKSDIDGRSEDQLLEEKIRNHQTLDSFVESYKIRVYQNLFIRTFL